MWWLLLPAGPAVNFQRGPLPGVALVGHGAVVVLVVFSLPDLWMISPAERGCSGQRGGGLAACCWAWMPPGLLLIVSAGWCPALLCKRKSLSGLIVGRAFVLSGGLIVWGCGCCTASSVGGWVSDLGRMGVCCVCPGIPPGGLIVGVKVVLGVLLPVLRRGVVLLICA